MLVNLFLFFFFFLQLIMLAYTRRLMRFHDVTAVIRVQLHSTPS